MILFFADWWFSELKKNPKKGIYSSPVHGLGKHGLNHHGPVPGARPCRCRAAASVDTGAWNPHNPTDWEFREREIFYLFMFFVVFL